MTTTPTTTTIWTVPAAEVDDTTSTQTTGEGLDCAGSLILAAFEQTWASIQRRHTDVPGVVVTWGAGTIGTAPGTVRLGHFAPSRWATHATATDTPMHELFIGGEGLTRGPVNLLGTLLHEAAHALAHARGIQDTSGQGRYHNARYKAVAEELGITVTQDGTIGWSATTVPDATASVYGGEVDSLSRAIRAYRRAESGRLLPPTGPDTTGDAAAGDGAGEQDEQGRDVDEKKRRNGVALVCGCPSPRRIRVALSVALAGPISCGLCGSDFHDPHTTAAG